MSVFANIGWFNRKRNYNHQQSVAKAMVLYNSWFCLYQSIESPYFVCQIHENPLRFQICPYFPMKHLKHDTIRSRSNTTRKGAAEAIFRSATPGMFLLSLLSTSPHLCEAIAVGLEAGQTVSCHGTLRFMFFGVYIYMCVCVDILSILI